MVADVENEYKKFPELNKDEVLKLMDWCIKQPHLPNLTEFEIILFLHSCYNSMEAAKKCIDTSFTIRTHTPEFFAKRDVLGDDVKTQMSIMVYTPLPGLTPEGYKPIYGKLVDTDSSKYSFTDTVKLFSFVTDLCFRDEGTVKGYILIVDLDGLGFGHLAKVNIMAMKKYMLYLQEGMPIRLKGLHIINTVSFMDKILALMRPFMKKELMDLLELHTSVESFIKNVNPDQLPNEYGGKAGTFHELWEKSCKYVNENREYFLKEECERRVNEKLRPGKPKGATDLFGVEGNFKKLDFD